MDSEANRCASLTVHATLVRFGGEGVLLLGESGIGKSTTALEWLSAGGQLVADDLVVIERIGGELLGTAPERLQGILSIPELGIFDVRDVLGPEYFMRTAVVTQCVRLVYQDYSERDAIETDFQGLRPPISFRKVDRSRKSMKVKLRIDDGLLKQSEARFFQSHDKLLASAYLA